MLSERATIVTRREGWSKRVREEGRGGNVQGPRPDRGAARMVARCLQASDVTGHHRMSGQPLTLTPSWFVSSPWPVFINLALEILSNTNTTLYSLNTGFHTRNTGANTAIFLSQMTHPREHNMRMACATKETRNASSVTFTKQDKRGSRTRTKRSAR